MAIDEFFGHYADTAEESRRRWQELMGASVGCRFLLEVAAARPPSGARLPSDNRIQELLATAMAIEEFGRVSDLIAFKLTKDAKVGVVPPGLLRAHASDMIAVHEAFSAALRRGDVSRSAARRTSTLSPDSEPEDDDELKAGIEAAYLSDQTGIRARDRRHDKKETAERKTTASLIGLQQCHSQTGRAASRRRSRHRRRCG